MKKKILLFSGISGTTAVMLGAMGAHALKAKLDANDLNAYETAVRYQLFHTFVLMIIALLITKTENKWLTSSAYFIGIGMLLFSGSIYLLSTQSLFTSMSLLFLGPITPLGGLLMISGWVMFTISIYKSTEL